MTGAPLLARAIDAARCVRAELLDQCDVPRTLAGQCGLASMRVAEALGAPRVLRVGFFVKVERFLGRRGRYPSRHAWWQLDEATDRVLGNVRDDQASQRATTTRTPGSMSTSLATDLNRLVTTKPYPARPPLSWQPWTKKPGWLIAEARTAAYELGKFIINARTDLTYLVVERPIDGSWDVRSYHLCVGRRH